MRRMNCVADGQAQRPRAHPIMSALTSWSLLRLASPEADGRRYERNPRRLEAERRRLGGAPDGCWMRTDAGGGSSAEWRMPQRRSGANRWQWGRVPDHHQPPPPPSRSGGACDPHGHGRRRWRPPEARCQSRVTHVRRADKELWRGPAETPGLVPTARPSAASGDRVTRGRPLHTDPVEGGGGGSPAADPPTHTTSAGISSGKTEIDQRGPKLEADCRHTNAFVASDPFWKGGYRQTMA